MWVGIAYLVLAFASVVLWAGGFETYNCPAATCRGIDMLLDRPLLLWGTVYFATGSLACALGSIVLFRGVAAGLLAAGATAHAAIIALTWNREGSLCPVCALFLALEIILVIVIYVFPPFTLRRKSVILVSVVLAAVVLLLVVNPAPPFPNFLGNGGAPVPPGLVEGAAMIVLTTEKTAVTLNLKERPALLWAWWCPQCKKELHRLARHPAERRPYLVLAFAKSDGDLERARSKLTEVGLDNEIFYILPDDKAYEIGIPAFLYWDERSQAILTR